MKNKFFLVPLLSVLFFLPNISLAQNKIFSNNSNVVIHVNNNNKRTFKMALAYTRALKNKYLDKISITIVTDGPGVGMVNSQNKYKNQVESLLKKGVKINACNTTIKKLLKVKKLPIIEGVKIVPNGVVEVFELQRKGYYYLRP